MESEELKEKLAEFLEEYYKKDLLIAVAEGKKSVEIDFSLLEKFDSDLADYLLENPEETIEIAEEAIKELDISLSDEKINLRFFNLPEERNIRIRNLRSEHIGKLIVVDGIVKRASEVRPEISEAIFQCPSCGELIKVKQAGRYVKPPSRCPQCGAKKGFKLSDQKYVDSRWIVIEEPFEITSGERPSDIFVHLQGDLTTPRMQNKTDPGNRIKITGILKELPRKVKGSMSTQMEIYIEANHVESVETEWEEIEITPEDEKEILNLAKDPHIYEKLIASIAPALYGLDEIKLAIALQLFGGEEHTQKDGSRVRGDIHILLVGDPSTAKSAIMKVASQLIPRGRYVSGKGVTAAGLTASVVRDEEFLGGWVLEAGALVLANRSLCAIDEFEKVDKQDQVALHEAMELQSYHPSVEIMLADGKKVKIGELVEEIFKKHKEKVKKGINCEFLTDISGVEIVTTDFDGYYITKPKYISRHKAPKKFVKITFSNGREVVVTPNHPIYIYDGKIRCIDASSLKVGMFVPGVNKLKVRQTQTTLTTSMREGRKKIFLPKGISEEFGKFLGYFLTEGYSYRGSSYEIGISNTNSTITSDVNRITQSLFGVKSIDYTRVNRTQRIVSKDLYLYLGRNFPSLLKKSKEKRVPKEIFSAPEKIVRAFLKAAFLGDGSIENNKRICFRTSCRGLAEDYQDLLAILGIHSTIVEDKHNSSFKVYITSDSILRFRNVMKGTHLEKELDRLEPSKRRQHDVVPSEVGKKIICMLKTLGLSYTGYFNLHIKKQYGINKWVVEKYLREIKRKTVEVRKKLEKAKTIREIRKIVGWSQYKSAKEIGVKRSKIYYAEIGGYSLQERKMLFNLLKSKVKERIEEVERTVKEIEKLMNLRWWRVKEVEIVPNEGRYKTEWVYDLTVEKTSNFISHGLILHNTISIAKANIVATLPARTAILAGGNPKFGRFDPYIPIKEQLDVPETLLSRFDLKFALRDVPNPETDKAIVEHIIKARHIDSENVEPAIPVELFRKYVAYARKNCHPVLTEEAAEELKKFYLELRSKATEASPIPITLRQFEALIRLAEASAKVQLRNEVTREDALRAIRLMSASLRQFGFEPETGTIDIDRAEGQKATAAQRSKIRTIISIIDELEKIQGKEIPIDDIIKRAKEQGIENAEEILTKMQREGILYSPKPGFVSKS